MKHGVKKIKFRNGQDAHQALTRKLLLNFIRHGKLETTLKRAKVVKSSIDSLTSKSITGTESSKNVLLRELGDRDAVKKMMSVVAPTFKEGTGGFVRLQRLGQRQGDNAEVALLTWTKEIVQEESEKSSTKEVKKNLGDKKSASKKEAVQ